MYIDLRLELNMAEYTPPPKTLFSVKIVNGQFVVENHDDSDDTVPEGVREYYHTCLNKFQSALTLVHEKDYDKDVISQLMLSNNNLVLCQPNRRIDELELSLAPLQHQLAAYEFILETGTAETDEPSQQAAGESPG